MNDDEQMGQALRVALDERAALVEPSERLTEVIARTRATRPTRAARLTRWWVPLAAAASVLAVVAGVWSNLPARRDPVPGGGATTVATAGPSAGPTTPAPAPTTTAPTTPAPTTTASTPPPPATAAPASLPVYYVAPIGDDARIVRLYREWLTAPGVTRDSAEQVRARAAVELAMTAVPSGTDGYLRTWGGVDLVDVAVTRDRITLTLSGPGSTRFPQDTERVSVQQLVWTAQAAVGRGTLPVRFVLVDGADAIFGTQPVDRAYDRPASRDLYHQDLAPIWVTSPTRGQELASGPVTVQGEACVFEATVSWQLLRGGSIVDEGFVTATIGAPARGTFEIPLGTLSPGSYAVRAFEVSPEDGAVSAETTMPFTVR